MAAESKETQGGTFPKRDFVTLRLVPLLHGVLTLRTRSRARPLTLRQSRAFLQNIKQVHHHSPT
jgi:hypothetical protein